MLITILQRVTGNALSDPNQWLESLESYFSGYQGENRATLLLARSYP